MGDWASIIAIVVSAIVGLIVYSVNKEVDRRYELKKLKEEAYSEFLRIMFLAITSSDSALKTRLNMEYFTLFAIASDKALIPTGDLWVYLRDTSPASDGCSPKQTRTQEEVNAKFVNMFRAMRKDCFEETQLSDQEIIERFPLEV